MTLLAVDIRPAEKRDARAIAAVHEAAWKNAYAGIIPHKTLAQWWLGAARLGGTTRCYLPMPFWWPKLPARSPAMPRSAATAPAQLSQQGEIYELYLAPEYQGLGFGGRLFAAARARIADFGLKGMVVWALEDNSQSPRLL